MFLVTLYVAASSSLDAAVAEDSREAKGVAGEDIGALHSVADSYVVGSSFGHKGRTRVGTQGQGGGEGHFSFFGLTYCA